MSVISRREFHLAEAAWPLAIPRAAVPQPIDRDRFDGGQSNGGQSNGDRSNGDRSDGDRALAMELLRGGEVDPHRILQALSEATDGTRLIDVLTSRRILRPETLYKALGKVQGLGVADLRALKPDARLIDRLGAQFCLTHQILPWQSSGGGVVIATAQAEAFQTHHAKLTAVFGSVSQVLAPAERIETALRAARGAQLARAAETLLAREESCRDFRTAGVATWTVLAALVIAALSLVSLTLTALLIWAALTLAATVALKIAALVQTLRAPPPAAANPAVLARLPMVSIMVALYRESDIAARLVRRLGRLDYPQELLDILLIVEEDDHQTRDALYRANLPAWIRVVVAPRGRVKTKPRALNFGLSLCRGSIVGVYDAEDAPEADQIRKVVDRFHQRGPDVACLQGRLDFYNPRRNWLARCFTVEYAGWFRVMLPGLQRLGVALPLGGTTLFFRRDILERLGGWDAHNVTEDADLGMRLARHGYRTEIIETTTFEEANCVALPWVKQRSRWVKGYMMTYLAHMRSPRLLWRQLGPRAFFGFQILFLGSLSQALLAPLMWSMITLQIGLGHPVAPMLGHAMIITIAILFALAEAVNVAIGIIGLRRSGHDLSAAWVPTLTLYFPLQALAAYKALWEVLTCPFYWDKTSHGAFSEA